MKDYAIQSFPILRLKERGFHLLKVLIMESDSIIAKGVKILATEAFTGITAEYYHDAKSALAASTASNIDLFIIGVSSTKKGDGLHFMRAIRQDPKYAETYVILLASAEDRNVRKIILNEFDYFRFFTAPIDHAKSEIFKQILIRASTKKTTNNDSGYINLIKNGNDNAIKLSDILWIDIEERVVTFNMIDGTHHNYMHGDYSLKNLMIMFGNDFLRVFRSIIVNKYHIIEIDYEAKWLRLRGVNKTFKLGNTYIQNVKDRLGDSLMRENKNGDGNDANTFSDTDDD